MQMLKQPGREPPDKLCLDYAVLESQLARAASVINAKREYLFASLGEAVDELRDVELARLGSLGDALKSVHAALNAVLTKLVAVTAKLKDDAGILSSSVENVRLLRGDSELDFGAIVDALDYLKAFLQRTAGFLGDVAEAERTVAKGSQRVLEKHGYAKNTSVAFGVVRNSAASRFSSSLACLVADDSSSVRRGWESFVQTHGTLSENHLTTSELYASKVYQAMESAMKRVAEQKRLLVDKQGAHVKGADKLRGQLFRQNQQLVKIQRDLQVLKEESKEEAESVASMVKRGLGIEQLGAKMLSSRLGVAVGLESENDRSSRVLRQVDALAAEERSLSGSIESALTAESSYLEACRNEMNSLLSSVELSITQEMKTIKNSLKLIIGWNSSFNDSFQSALISIKACIDCADVRADFTTFAESVRKSSESDHQLDLLVDVPPVLFERLSRPAVDEEVRRRGQDSTALESVAAMLDEDGDEDEDREGQGAPQGTPEKLPQPEMPLSPMGRPLRSASLTSDSIGLKGLSEATPNELAVFGLDSSDKVLEVFNCALYPAVGLISQGKLYITQHYMAFIGFGGSWEGMRILVALKEIVKIEKTNVMMIIPTAVQVTDSTGEEYFFGSFLDRDSCYSMLLNISEAEKQLAKIAGSAVDNRNLNLGYQTGRPERPKEDTRITEPRRRTGDLLVAHSDSRVSEDPQAVRAEDMESIDILSFFKENGISLLHEESVPYAVDAVFKTCWLHGLGFGDFLVHEGDLGLRYDEWAAAAVTPEEDKAKLCYSFTRNFVFEHPRTTMLFIGPKNAPARQVHHLYTGNNCVALDEWKPSQVINTTVSKFEGFPFANTFKVVQYWTMSVDPADASRTVVRLGVRLHFIIQTMFKSQIIAGTESELVKQAKRWIAYCCVRASKPALAPARDAASQPRLHENEIAVAAAFSRETSSTSTFTLALVAACLAVALVVQWRSNAKLGAEISALHDKVNALLLHHNLLRR